MSTASDRGFTLLELIVTLAIAAIVLVMVVPTGSQRQGHRELERGARDVAAALRLTRSRAILANEPAVLVVDVGNAFYRPAGATRASALPRGVRVGLVTTEDEELSAAAGTIRFYADGSSSGGGLSLSLGDSRVDVLVDWLTGGVSLHDHAQTARR